MITKYVNLNEIDPPFSPINWDFIWQEKAEIINGDVYHIVDHWSFNIIDRHKAFTPLGFYQNPEKPDELIRIAGLAPDLQVLLFKRKS